MWWSWFVCSTLIPGLLGCNGPCNESENAKCAWKSHSMGLRVAVAGPAIINAHYFQVMLRNKMLVLEHVFKEPGPGRPPGEGGFSAASWMRRSKLLKIWGALASVAQVGRASSCPLKGHGFDFRSGQRPMLVAGSISLSHQWKRVLG